jgi:sugar/nucleoside kinase (ribokinase family)
MDIGSAISFANQAAALSVTKPGAQSSIPDMQAIKEYFT